ncbi:Carcinoembryonic antigen-related cell adhesion molecule 15 [Lemmus lemmus]
MALRNTKETWFSAAEGAEVLLYVPNQAENLRSFHCYKGKCVYKDFTIVHYEKAMDLLKLGNKTRSREEISKEGSMMIQNVNQEATGIYTLESLGAHSLNEIIHVHLESVQ